MVLRWNSIRLFALPIIFFCCVYVTYIALPQSKCEKIINVGNCQQSFSGKQMATRLARLMAKLQSAPGNTLKPTEHALADIQQMIIELDPAFSISSKHKESDVCPEVYTNSSYGHQYYMEGWITPNCGYGRPIGELITILLNPIPPKEAICAKFTNWILAGLKEYYPTVSVIMADRYKECRPSSDVNIKVVDFPEDASDGVVWNKLISKVKTKYALIGRGLDHLTWFARIERQVAMFGVDDRVKVVGGAFRNISGHWKMGCYQSEMKNYVLEYKYGYHTSFNECAICDYISSPFVVLADFAKEISFREDFPRGIIFEDFFLRVRESGAFVLTCPDAMYFSSDSIQLRAIQSRTPWLPIVHKWQLNRILFPPNIKHVYTCKESEINCVLAMDTQATKSFLIPPCCMEQYTAAWKFMQEFSEKHSLWIESDTGSALGAVKLSGILPWDIDGDMIYLSSDHDAILSRKEEFASKGFRLSAGESPKFNSREYGWTDGYIRYWTPDGTIEMWGETMMSNHYLPLELRDVRTKAEMNGNWVFSPSNPGLFARNRYGVEVLRHAQSYRHTGKQHSFIAYDAGYFLPCSKKNHHACLDQYHPDGNLQFAVP